ncbi:hypothetical protein P8955_13805 [Enterococcus faecium]|uniref:hypothetical protein n=1 Tax=Enterococcus faecium TaxID=1352 RepID=UPI0024155660|nr:hypothetical protein [Enterococcus faecium]MDG4644169.1 hypothetical protein [Enterococcus faecium]MDG4646779.1 hypothetical protein [Enterococcus faecium]
MKAGHLKDIDKPSEPFEVIGKIIPRYENENWTFTELLYEAPYLTELGRSRPSSIGG